MPTRLEETMPVYHFHERHSRWIAASSADVWQALTTLRLDQLTLARLLVAIRHLGIHTPGTSEPLFTDGPIPVVEVVAPTYAIGCTVGRPWQRRPARRDARSLADFVAFNEPGWTKYVTDFHLQPRNGGVELSTETRGYSTDDWARRRFAVYWALIRPASGVVRRDLLATVDRLATATASPLSAATRRVAAGSSD